MNDLVSNVNKFLGESFFALMLGGVLLCFTGCGNVEIVDSTSHEKPPNIVLILADDLGYGDLSCFGATLVETPNIDQIAKNGMRFINAYSPHSVCTPTRYGIMTGRYAWRSWNGHETVWANDPMLIDTNRLTLPKILKEVGYKTALIGKWHLGFGSPGQPGWDDVKGPDYNRPLKPGPLEIGFDYFYGIPHVGQFPHMFIENHNVVGLSERDSMHIILDERFENRPSYQQRKHQPPRHKFEGYESARYNHEDVAVNITERAVNWIKNSNEEPFFLMFAHRNIHTPLKPNEKFKNTSQIGVYGDFINELDWSVGEILNSLIEKGVDENTIVIFASDNGGVMDYMPSKLININGHSPNGPFFGQKTEVYEGGVHIPLIVSWPRKMQKGVVSEKLVGLTDIMATMGDLFEYEIPWNAGEDSFSFLSELLGEKSSKSVRESIVLDSRSGLVAIREGDWKFISGKGGGSGRWWKPNENNKMDQHQWDYPDDFDNPPGQLYNLKNDPMEQNNLYYEHPDIVVDLKAKLTLTMYNGRSR